MNASFFFTLFFVFFYNVISAENLILQNEVSEDDVLLYLKNKILPNNPVILEAGAHYGEHTKKMKNLWPQATMHTFEPLDSSFSRLLEIAKNEDNVFCYNYALSSYTGKTNFYINPGNDGASSIGAPVDFNKNEFLTTPIEVECTTISQWADEYEIKAIDFMWLDMEGHELKALMNAGVLLNSVKAIYTEIDFIKVRDGSCLYFDLKSFLEKNGFHEVWKRSWGALGNPLFQGDALFIKKNIDLY